MYRLFLDANILFTAAYNPQGKAALIIEMARQDCWSVLSSEYAIEEARRNLSRKRPAALEGLDQLLQAVEKVSTAPLTGTCPVNLPPKDQPILMAALACKASHLLTGDLRDFGPHLNQPDKTAGLVIQTVTDFLDNL